MAEGRSRKRNTNKRKGSAGIITALLFVVIVAAVCALYIYKQDEINSVIDKLVNRQTVIVSGDGAESKKHETGTGQANAAGPDAEDGLSEGSMDGGSGKAALIKPIVIEEETEQTTEPRTQYKPEITVTFAGDILLDPSYAIMASVLQRGGDLRTSFDEGLLSIMESSDIFMINNEFPYSDRGTPLANKAFTFRAKPEYAAQLKNLGVDIVALANNHVNDYGRDAMLDTFATLENEGIPYVGAGRNIDEASAPYYMECEGVKIAFLCATQIERLGNPDTVEATATTPGVFRCLSPTRLEEQIKLAKANADIVVLYVHWGTEGKAEIDWAQIDQAPRYAAAGADVIIGDHPHVLQKAVMVDNVPVIYSLGNYLFTSSTVDTGLVQLRVDTETKKISDFEFIPALQKGCKTQLLDGSEKTRIIEYMNSIGSELDAEGHLIMKQN